LILGFVLPAVCRYKDIKIFNYWECFAFLLYYRTLTSAGQSLDVIFYNKTGNTNYCTMASLIQAWILGDIKAKKA